jgi:DNA-binding NarL/FixJ family response regulator
MTIRVLIADDQSMVRAGFRMLLSGQPDIEVAAEARDGLEATRRILAADDTARILILTTFGLDEYVYEALCAGANGFVLKDDPPEQPIAAVHTVAAGDALLSPAITKRAAAGPVTGAVLLSSWSGGRRYLARRGRCWL